MTRNHRERIRERRQYVNDIQTADGASSETSATPSSDNKSNQAAQMAQQLASQSSWADTYAPVTPATTATPVASTADGEEQDRSLNQEIFEAPPPSYEESRATHQGSTAMSGTPASPVSLNQQPNQDNAIKGIATGFWCTDGTPIPPLPQRNYTQHETHQSITGTFTFHDALDLSTQSGSINICIDPQASNVTGVIRLSSQSGSIKVRFSDEFTQRMKSTGALDRRFDIKVKTASGSQNLELPIGNGSTVNLAAASGTISVTAFAASMGPNDANSTLSTQTVTGTQRVQVKNLSREPITALGAKHYASGSASLKLGYPATWDGMVHASVGGSGSLDVKGSNLHFQRNGNKEVYAWRMRGDESEQKKRQGQVVEARCDGSGNIKVDCSST